MFFKKTDYRKFDYTPQFYDPEEDEEAKEMNRRKRRLGFRRASTRHKVKTKSPLYYVVMLIIAILVYLAVMGEI